MKYSLSLYTQIADLLCIASDVAAAMADLEVELSSCRTCHKACSAAVKMIEVGLINFVTCRQRN